MPLVLPLGLWNANKTITIERMSVLKRTTPTPVGQPYETISPPPVEQHSWSGTGQRFAADGLRRHVQPVMMDLRQRWRRAIKPPVAVAICDARVVEKPVSMAGFERADSKATPLHIRVEIVVVHVVVAF